MKNLFVPYELSTAAKKKGFDEPCMAWYTVLIKDGVPEFKYNYEKQGTWFKHNSDPETLTWNDPDSKCSAPLYDQILDWFKKEHKIYIQIVPFAKYFKQEWQYELLRLEISEFKSPKREGYNKYIKLNDFILSSYHEAMNRAIGEALTLI